MPGCPSRGRRRWPSSLPRMPRWRSRSTPCRCSAVMATSRNIRWRDAFATPRRARSTRAPTRCSGSSSPRAGARLMDFALNDEQREIREMVHDICLERVEPRAAEIDESGEFPWDIKELFAKHDILAIPFTPEYGGVSGSALTLIVAVEEISKFCVTSSLILSVQSLGSLPIWLAGSEEQKRKYLPPLASGEQMAAFPT